MRTRCIDDPRRIWWDARPNPNFPTLEFRIFDICTRIDETICIAALMQALVVKLIRLRRSNLAWRDYRRTLITENRWRAARYGIHGKMIDFGKRAEVPMADLIGEILELVDDVVDDYDLRKDVEYVHTILKEGTSADRQLAIYRETGSLAAVVDHLIAETREGCQIDLAS